MRHLNAGLLLVLINVLSGCDRENIELCRTDAEPTHLAEPGCGFDIFHNYLHLDSTMYLVLSVVQNVVPVSTSCSSHDLSIDNPALLVSLIDRRAGTQHHSYCTDDIDRSLPKSPEYRAKSGTLDLWIVPYEVIGKTDITYRLWTSLHNIIFTYKSDSIILDHMIIGVDEQDNFKKLKAYDYASYPAIEPSNLEDVKLAIKARWETGGSAVIACKVPRKGIPEIIYLRISPDDDNFKRIVTEEFQKLRYPERKSYELPEVYVDYLGFGIR